MKPTRLFVGAAHAAALAALLSCFAAPAMAQSRQMYYLTSPVFPGIDCSRCAPGAGFCVINPIRFEYTCAPAGTFACAGFQRTSYCAYGQTCWDGICR
jgi:hypothetical protein